MIKTRLCCGKECRNEAFRELDGQFHREVASISGNPVLLAVSEALFRWLTHFHVDLAQRPRGLEKLTLAEHRAILDAIDAKKPSVAAKAMRDHLYRVNSLYRRKDRSIG